jgi:hypothetical protein
MLQQSYFGGLTPRSITGTPTTVSNREDYALRGLFYPAFYLRPTFPSSCLRVFLSPRLRVFPAIQQPTVQPQPLLKQLLGRQLRQTLRHLHLMGAVLEEQFDVLTLLGTAEDQHDGLILA